MRHVLVFTFDGPATSEVAKLAVKMKNYLMTLCDIPVTYGIAELINAVSYGTPKDAAAPESGTNSSRSQKTR